MLSLILQALLASPSSAVNNGLARWNNWNSLGCDISQTLLLDTSRVLLDTGIRDVGYKYVVLDDCWSDGRSSRWLYRR